MPVASCVPSTLLAQAGCLQSCLSLPQLQAAFLYLLCAYRNTLVSVPCDAQSLATAAASLQVTMTTQQIIAAQTVLLAQLAGQSTDPQTLQALATQFQDLSPQQLLAMNCVMLCQIA
jgi:hypothetical protein